MQILEHIHVNVDSIGATEQFLRAALPEFTVRGGGDDPHYGQWLHIGTEDNYIALTQVPGAEPMPNLRHIGLQVDDIEALIERLQGAGYAPSDASALEGHPHRRRVYFADGNGLYWEFVQYLSEDPAQRNDYSH